MQNIILVIGALVILGGGLLFINSSSDEMTETATTEESMTENEMTEESSDEMADMDEMAAPSNTIVDIAVGTPSVSTLVAAVTAASLVDTLKSEGPFTVFAPVNEAFAALPAGTVDTLLLPENIADLQAILTYHVVPGSVMAGDLVDGMVVETVNGETITINVSATEGVTINGAATVVAADVVASNGVIHLIDSVLLPPTE